MTKGIRAYATVLEETGAALMDEIEREAKGLGIQPQTLCHAAAQNTRLPARMRARIARMVADAERIANFVDRRHEQMRARGEG